MVVNGANLFSLSPWSGESGNALALPWRVSQPAGPSSAHILNAKSHKIAQVAVSADEVARRARTVLGFVVEAMNATEDLRPKGVSWDHESARYIRTVYKLWQTIRRFRGAFSGCEWFEAALAVSRAPIIAPAREGLESAAGQPDANDRRFYYDGRHGSLCVGEERDALVCVNDHGILYHSIRRSGSALAADTYATLSPTVVARNAAWQWAILETVHGFDRVLRRGLGHPSGFGELLNALRAGLPDMAALAGQLRGPFAEKGENLFERIEDMRDALACIDAPVERNRALLDMNAGERERIYARRHRGKRTEKAFGAESRRPRQLPLDI